MYSNYTTIFIIVITIIGIILVYFLLFPNIDKACVKVGLITYIRHHLFGGGYKKITADELYSLMSNDIDNIIIYDIRRKTEYEKAHISGSLSTPFNELVENKSIKSDKNMKRILVCCSGVNSGVACSILSKEGYLNLYNLIGGVSAWNYGVVGKMEDNIE